MNAEDVRRALETHSPASIRAPMQTVCWNLFGFCRCGLDRGHDGSHLCNGCSAEWSQKPQLSQPEDK